MAVQNILLALVAVLLAGPTTQAESPLVVIVHPTRVDQLTRDDVARIYLKQHRHWSDGHPIVPLNRGAGSPARERFAHAVFGGRSQSHAEYWNEQYFHGRLPPATLSSDAAVKQYVATDPDAVGYIDASLVDESVRVAFELP